MSLYPLEPNRIKETTPKHRTAIKSYENGVEQRISRNFEVRETYTLVHYMINKEKRDTLKNFFNDRKGSFEKFLFDNYESNEQVVVRFADDELKFERVGVERYNVSVRLVECH